MRLCDFRKLLLGFRERDIKAGFPGTHSGQQILHREGRLAHPRITLYEVKPLPWKTAAQNIIQPRNSRGFFLRRIKTHNSKILSSHRFKESTPPGPDAPQILRCSAVMSQKSPGLPGHNPCKSHPPPTI